MKITMFYHSLYSDWNHGNAHFLRGVVKELMHRGHDVSVYEPAGGWSLNNLLKDYGIDKLDEFRQYYPVLRPQFYNQGRPELTNILQDADLVIVHEWNTPELISLVGELKRSYHFKLLFHDTHHRAVSDPESLGNLKLSEYDGALVFGEVLNKIYRERKWVKNVWTWHEAADAQMFRPMEGMNQEGDLVWIGNWGDDERSEELMEFLIRPVQELGIKAKVYGVRYPESARLALQQAGIEYGGWLPNYKVPEVFAKYHLTIHVPRRQYTQMLPGIPTIRPFEALSCGIPLISAPWEDAENLFDPESDYLLAYDGKHMKEQIQRVLNDEHLSHSLSKHGRNQILEHHTCAHRVDELEDVWLDLGLTAELIHPKNSSLA